MLFLIKFLGLFLITVSTTAVGINKSKQLFLRVSELEWYVKATRAIADKIRYSGDELAKVLLSLQGNAEHFSISSPFKVVLKKNSLNTDDQKAIGDFFENIGLGDTENQLNICSLYSKELSIRLDEARKELREKSKLFKSLGFFIGLGVAIILI